MRHLYPILLFLLPLVSIGQNLVPNPSFEEHSDCPYSPGDIHLVEDWVSFSGSCDYYHECGINGFGIPIGYSGGGLARTGQAYAQMNLYSPIVPNGREFLEVELTQQLSFNNRYIIRFYMSLQDSLNYAINSIGAHFSSQPHSPIFNDLYDLTPQFQYSDTAFIVNKTGWTEISGNFIATGNEQYLAIGNFKTDSATESFLVGNGGSTVNFPEGFWDVAGYYIDDVSVVQDTTYQVGIQENSFQFSIHPNPATDNLRIESQTPLAEVKLTDLAGRTSVQQTFRQAQGDVSVDVSHLPSGIYLLEAITQNGRRSVQKVVVE